MAKIKALNENGIKLFYKLINARRAGRDFPVDEILSNPSNYVSTPFKSEIDPKLKFENRYKLAIYLTDILKEFDDHEDEYGEQNKNEFGKGAGLWSWIALVYFDQLSPSNPSDIEHYIFVPHLGLRYYRHSVFMPFKLYKRWREDSRVFISSKIDTEGQMWESALSRDYLMNSIPAVRLIAKIYGDPRNNFFAKSGASSQPSKAILKSGKRSRAGYGGIERFARVIQRLKLTYHVQSLNEYALLELMGDEFKKWIEET